MNENLPLNGWAAAVARVVRGDLFYRPQIFVGPTPSILKDAGLNSGALAIMVAKIARCRREHPEVPLQVWYDLPALLAKPMAIFPSARADGSLVSLLVAIDRNGNPVIVALAPASGDLNVVLSVYGKNDGFVWAAKEMARARANGHCVFESKGFAASLPQPPAAETASSSHGPIPSDGTAKPDRVILRLRKESIKS